MNRTRRKGVRSIWLALLLITTSAYVIPRLALRGECSSFELFNQVRKGMTKGEVFQILGTPNEVVGRDFLPRLTDNGSAKVKEVLIYYSPTRLLSAKVAICPDNTVGDVVCAFTKSHER